MMKTTLFFISVLCCTFTSYSQFGADTSWAWIKGDNTIDQYGVYGIKGVTDPLNKPGSRNSAVTWRDNAGDLWLFGGIGYETSSSGFLNDLWKYDPISNNWVWMKGDNIINLPGVYGAKGNANPLNQPGARYLGFSWTDDSGNLWLFGGFGYGESGFGFLNDLWKYNPGTNQWTWISGDKTIDQEGSYGTRGVSHPTNKPGGRYGSKTWIDTTGKLWLFGGYGMGEANSGILNDLWNYNPSTGRWTWINGDKNVDELGVYGALGVSNSSNKPGARYVAASWTDLEGNFWLFGGYGFGEAACGNLSDLWKYDLSTNIWTWINGDKVVDQPGTYGIQGIAGDPNKPGARNISTSWTDVFGDLWIFGGYGFGSTNSGYLNDIWKYSPSGDQWTWVKGDCNVNQLGVYGTQGMPDPNNKTGGRTGCVSWTDGTGNLWLFGGTGYDGSTSGILNDLWKISTLLVLPIKLLQFKGVQQSTGIRLQWQSMQEFNFSHYTLERSFDGITFSSVADINGKGNSDINNYEYLDPEGIRSPSKKVFYRLKLTDIDGKFNYSRIIGFNLDDNRSMISLFPNPTVHSLTLSFDNKKPGKVMLDITDIRGIVVKQLTDQVPGGRVSMSIDLNGIAAGNYILSVRDESGTNTLRFVKQ